MTGVLVVTGGSRGIGAACAKLAGSMGYSVAVNYAANVIAADHVCQEITDAGGKAIAIRADIASEGDIIRLFETVDRELGPVTALVNNAGVIGRKKRVEDLSLARLTRVFQTNISGSILCAREAIKRMSTKHGGKGGAIVNMSSAASRLGSPNEFVDYAASKGAIDTFTTGLAVEVAEEGIRVNAVRPGLIYTEIHEAAGDAERVDRLKVNVPMKRGGTPDEVADTVLWLLSDKAAYVTGAFVDVTGGR